MGLLRRTPEDALGPFSDKPLEGTNELRLLSAKIHTVGCSGLRTASVRGFRLSSGDGADVAGFDLGPSPEEHLLAAVGSSLAQAISNVACSRDLSIDRIDIALDAEVILDPISGNGTGTIRRVHVVAVIASEDPVGHFAGIGDDVLAHAPLVSAVTFPVELSVNIEKVEPSERHADWQI
ncbi:OsmC family protein [soil metagenome]